MQRPQNLQKIKKAHSGWPEIPDLPAILTAAYDLGSGQPDSGVFSCLSGTLDGAPREVTKRLETLAGDHPGAFDAAVCLFYRGLVDSRVGARHRGRHVCAAQQELSLAAYHLPVRSLAVLLGAPDFLPLDRAAWTRACVGAVGFARAAHALGTDGVLYMPTPIEDMKEKIDLVLALPSTVLCLTIKTDAYATETTHRVLDAEGLRSDMETWYFRFARGVEEFGRRHAADCVPVYLSVGVANERLERDPRGCPAVVRGAKALIARFSGT